MAKRRGFTPSAGCRWLSMRASKVKLDGGRWGEGKKVKYPGKSVWEILLLWSESHHVVLKTNPVSLVTPLPSCGCPEVISPNAQFVENKLISSTNNWWGLRSNFSARMPSNPCFNGLPSTGRRTNLTGISSECCASALPSPKRSELRGRLLAEKTVSTACSW